MTGLFRATGLALMLAAVPLSAQFHRDEVPDRAGDGVRKHYLLRREQPLREAERLELARRGIEVIQPVGGNDYVVRGGSAALTATGLREIEPASKIAPSARRELSALRATAKLRIVFHGDVLFENAREIIRSAGATLSEPLVTGFGVLRSLDVLVPHNASERLALEDEVFQIHGLRRVIAPDNATAASLSSVTPLYTAPYDLSGRDVNVSMWDCGVAQADHREFVGRMTLHDPGSALQHPTHVAGTVGASGLNAPAKGMAPQVTMHQFALPECVGGGNGRPFLEAKDEFFSTLGIDVDNNSWSYVVGWFLGSDGQWTFYNNQGEFGLYDFDSAAIDHITRERGTLMVFSAGNDADDTGPSSAPFAHKHPDDDTTWCVSSDGSGSDCGTACGRCELARHPVDGPFPSTGVLATTKNVLAVGAVQGSRLIADFSSRGPTRDGRIKPDVVAKGTQVFSTLSGNGYGTSQGTSMSTPVVTGISALLLEQWRRTMGGSDPRPQMLRALIIHGTEDVGNPGPDYTFGFGLVNAQNSVDVVRADNNTGSRIRSGVVAQGARFQIPMTVSAGSNVRLTMVWDDPEGIPLAQVSLVNDLDMRLIGPSGAVTLPHVLDPVNRAAPAVTGTNVRDTIEMIELANAPAGVYTLEVNGTRVSSPDGQTFALIGSGQFGTPTAGCTDPYEPNDSEAAVYGPLVRNSKLTAKTCTETDVDFYQVIANESGPVDITVEATSTPLRATLTGGPVPLSVDIAPGQKAVMQSAAGGGEGQPIASVSFIIRIQSIGAPGSNPEYTVTPNFGFTGARRRGTGR
jgi:hypothetical protein